MAPFTWIWDKICAFFKKFWHWLTGKGKGVWGKIGKVFGTSIRLITESAVWKKIVNGNVGRFIKMYGKTILATAGSVVSKALSVAGWVGLLADVKDMAETGACVAKAFEHKGDYKKMPSFCDGEATKAIVQWALEKGKVSIEGEKGGEGEGVVEEEKEEFDSANPYNYPDPRRAV